MLAISVAARKGGQARSTTVFHLAGAFAALGRRVVVIDADPQATASKLFLGAGAVAALPASRTAAALYGDGFFAAGALLLPTAWEAVRLLPGGEAAGAHDFPGGGVGPAEALRDALPDLAPLCDVLLMDTPPVAGLLTLSTLAAADVALTPVVCEVNAVHELQYLRAFLGRVRRDWNPPMRWLLCAAAYRARLSVHRAYAEALAGAYPDGWLPVQVPEAAVVKEAAVAGKPLPLWRPRTGAARAFVGLAEELLKRAGGKGGVT